MPLNGVPNLKPAGAQNKDPGRGISTTPGGTKPVLVALPETDLPATWTSNAHTTELATPFVERGDYSRWTPLRRGIAFDAPGTPPQRSCPAMLAASEFQVANPLTGPIRAYSGGRRLCQSVRAWNSRPMPSSRFSENGAPTN